MRLRGPPRLLRTAPVNPPETASDAALAPRRRLWVLPRNIPPPETLLNTVSVMPGEPRTCHSVGLSCYSNCRCRREPWSSITKLPTSCRFPGPLPNFVHAENRLVTVKAGPWGRNLLYLSTVVKVAIASSLNAPCPPPGTRPASPPKGLCTAVLVPRSRLCSQ